jgi:hypothetical protein
MTWKLLQEARGSGQGQQINCIFEEGALSEYFSKIYQSPYYQIGYHEYGRMCPLCQIGYHEYGRMCPLYQIGYHEYGRMCPLCQTILKFSCCSKYKFVSKSLNPKKSMDFKALT